MSDLQSVLNAARTPLKNERENNNRKFVKSIVESLTDDPQPVIDEMTDKQLIELQCFISQTLKQRIK